MRKQPDDKSLSQLKSAATKAAKSLNGIVRVAETASGDITPEAVTAVFNNLSHLLLTARQKALLSLSLAIASNGGDLTEPLVNAPAQIASPERIVGERIAGQQKSPRHNDDDIDFLDE